MAEEAQNYPPRTPQEYPPVTPQAQPVYQLPYNTPGQYASMPAPQIAPLIAQPPIVTPTRARPVRKARGGSAALVWLLGGCGLVTLIFIVCVAYFTMNVGNALSNSTSAIPTAQHNLMEIRAALDTYAQAHDGRYPPTLDKVVDSSLLTYTSKSGAKVYVEYTPPNAHSGEDAGVAGFYLGDMMKYGQLVDQKLYIRLLKNGSVVQENITRSPIQER